LRPLPLRVILLTSAYRHCEPILLRDEGACILLAIYTPGVIRPVEVENPLAIGGAILGSVEIEIPPCGRYVKLCVKSQSPQKGNWQFTQLSAYDPQFAVIGHTVY
jgi:hypothetical protein